MPSSGPDAHDTARDPHSAQGAEGYVDLHGRRFFQIADYDRMAPFFMSVVSDSDHWMFISSNGWLTCGRRNPDSALFPYYTEDKIQQFHGNLDFTTK